MSVKDILIKARSIRRFDAERPIEYGILTDLIEGVRYTPSTSNFQALKFHISNDSETNSKIRANTAWAKLLEGYDGPSDEENPTAYIVICLDTDISDKVELFRKDVGIAAQTINLLACEKGIGCCMIGSFGASKLISDLALTSNLSPQLVLALGYPAESPTVIDANGDVKYFRDEQGNHFVPKRKLSELII
ncbi:MAG: nitroreductase family protein [Clostridia bacterium]|nr:nitroreductase family protein [Clostridia bacterium]